MNSMLLTKLTPAETLLVRYGSQASIEELLKYTFMDLLLKQVLMIENVERQPHKSDPLVTYKYVSPGKNFSGHLTPQHELFFLEPFHKNTDNRILFKNCVQIGYENARSKRHLHGVVTSLPALQGVFSATFLERIFGSYNYTTYGLELKNQLEKEIKKLEKDLPDLLAKDKEKTLEMLRPLGGNVFLLRGLDLPLAKEIDEAFSKELAWQESAGSGCGGSTFHMYSSEFDSSCSSCSSDSSGCSSGCSGCGGCGGD